MHMMLPALRSTSTKSLAIFILALAVTAAVPASPQDETVPETPLQDSSTPIAEGVPTESGATQALAQVQATRVKGTEDANHPDKLVNLRKGDLVKIVTHLVEQGAINRQKLENSLQATEKSLQATEEGLQATEDENAMLADKNTHLVDENA